MTDKATRTTEMDTWAVVELMGHRVVGGRVSEAQVAGATLLRVDIPPPGPGDQPEGWVTQYYHPSALYCLTPTDEQTARRVVRRGWPPPHVYEQRTLPAPTEDEDEDGDGEYPF